MTAAGRQRREAVRRQAAELFEQKIKPLEVAQRLRVSRKSAYQWHQLWRDGGIEALVSRGPSGSRCRLSPRCLEKLAAHLEEGPAAHGWVEDQVGTAARVATLIGRKFHVWKEATWAEVKGLGRPAGATSASRTKQASPADRPEAAPGGDAATPRS
ncbi:helix-turn-helix domain-containing protein [Streptomyces avermitilis]|uniref:helix-turn-helix domain-containing protein n=1 Tax=Streptomyces avermitilis TaxID=33903 RepID=UPI0033B03481